MSCAGSAPAEELPDFDKLWDFQDPAATEERFRALLPRAEASGDVDYHAQLLTQIARTLGLRRRYDKAHSVLDQAEGMIADDMRLARARYLLERGRTLNSAGDPEAAVPLFLEAWELARSKGYEYHAVDAAHMLGIALPSDEGLRWNKEAIAYAERCSEERARNWLGPLHHNTWFTYLQRDDYETALKFQEKGLAFREQRGDERGANIARWCIYHTWRKMGRLEQALQAQRELLEAAGDEEGYTHEEIAECLHALGRTDEAQPYFAEAYRRLSKIDWLSEGEPERIERLKALGGL